MACALWCGTASAQPFGQCPAVGQDTSCQFLITVTNGGQSVQSDSSQGPYEGQDDSLIGVQNNSSKPLTQIEVSSPGVFGFDGDGICQPDGWPTSGGPTPSGCPPPFNAGPAGYSPNGYEGPTTWFSNVDPNQNFGTVNFNPPLAPGSSTYFSLEEPLAGNSYSAGPPTTLSSTLNAPAVLNRSGSVTTVQVGSPVTDSASVSGGSSPATGTVTYSVYSDSSCSSLVADAGTAQVTNGSAGPSRAVTLTRGTYYWQVSYSGDTNNQPGLSPCSAEQLNVADHFHIEAKAWIPFDRVVDPLRPERVPWLLSANFGDCYSPGVFSRFIRDSVVSLYNGNNHIQYGDSNADFKVIVSVDFDWNGTSISDFRSSTAYGKTIRYLEYSVFDYITTNSHLVECIAQSAQATSAASAQQVGQNGFKLTYSAAHPIVVGAPAIDGTLFGTVASDDTVSLTYDTDLFPSHGFRVAKNGTVQVTQVTNDASCLGSAFGVRGATLIAWGLTHEDNHGTYTVSPGDTGIVAPSRPSLLCSEGYWLSIASDQAVKIYHSFINPSSGAPHARLARAGHSISIRVARIGANGRPKRYISLAAAVRQGLVATQPLPTGTAILSSPAVPVAIKVSGSRPELDVSPLVNGKTRAGYIYSASRTLQTSLGMRVQVKGRRLRFVRGTPRPPVTKASVRITGRTAVVHLRASSPVGVVATVATIRGKRVTVRGGVIRLPRSKLRFLRFGSVDSLGDIEPMHGVHGR